MSDPHSRRLIRRPSARVPAIARVLPLLLLPLLLLTMSGHGGSGHVFVAMQRTAPGPGPILDTQMPTPRLVALQPQSVATQPSSATPPPVTMRPLSQRRHPALGRSNASLLRRRRELLRRDPALRFVLLDVPNDPALHPSAALRAVARRVLRIRINGQATVIILPRHPNGRAVLFAHGSDESANYSVDAHRSSRAITALVGDGYTWAESDAGFNNWGDPASLRDDLAVASWLRQHGIGAIDLGGDSMGGLDTAQLIPLVHPQAVFELFPVCDVRTVMHLFAIDIRYAHSPVSQLSPVAMRDVSGLPMLFTASPGDTLVPKATNADVCVHEARLGGARVREVTTTGEHNDPSNWLGSRLVRFLDSAAGGF